MEVLAITSSGASPTEVQRITDLFENGLMVLHLRKPKLDSKEVEDILKQIPKKYLPYIMIHGKYNLASKYNLRGVHLKRSHRNNNLSSRFLRFKLKLFHPKLKISTTFHSLQSLRENNVKYDYVLLSNVFNASSKFNFEDSGMKILKTVISKCNQNVFAIGGVKTEYLESIKEAQFAGAGLSSSIFKEDKAIAINELQDFLVA
jgi:thiamine-phosphate pyrophosphorylase